LQRCEIAMAKYNEIRVFAKEIVATA